MKQLYLTLLFFAVYTSAFAQQDFRKGYIVQKGDTVKGFVDYRGAWRSAQFTTFKASENSAPQKYTPTDIEAYGFTEEQKIFETKKVFTTDKTAASEELLFLNVLIKGQASIYFYRDEKQKDRFFLSHNGGTLTELLIQESYQVNVQTGRKYRVENKLYKAVLAQALSNCPSIGNKQTDQVSLSQHSLVKIAQKYNSCVGGVVYTQPVQKAEFKLGAVLTYSSSKLQFDGNHFLGGRTFERDAPNAGAGISMSISSPAFNEKLSLQMELLYHPINFSATFKEEESLARKNTYNVDFDIKYLKLPVQVRYIYPRGKLRPMINGGGVVGYAIGNKNELTKTSTFGDATYTEAGPVFGEGGFRNLTLGMTAGAGLVYSLYDRPLTLEARYERTDGISHIITLSSSITTIYGILSYSF